ncbi:MAG: AAA family ATPase [Chitinophagaceae bacterium]|nr:AAA family ATPase [Chitinophagaceae bacterium]
MAFKVYEPSLVLRHFVVLITGMSGTGKSTVILDLQSRGYKAIDLDNDTFSIWVDAEADPTYPDNEVSPGKDWVWNEPRVHELLAIRDTELLFVSGCASNMSKFYPSFQHIILLTAPASTIVARLQTREGNTYGRSSEEVARVLRLQQIIEPLLRRAADLEIDTSISHPSAVELILSHIGKSHQWL